MLTCYLPCCRLPYRLVFLTTADSERPRARKRQRIETASLDPSSYHRTTNLASSSSQSLNMMRLPETDHDGPSSGAPGVSAQAGPSSLNGSVDGLVATNGHKNGFTPLANGNSGIGAVMGNGIAKHGKSIAKVNLPGTTLYDDSFVNREEFVRLVIQTLRDVGYAYVLSVLQNMQLFAEPCPIESLQQPLRLNLVIPWKCPKYHSSGNIYSMGCGPKLKQCWDV